MTSPIETNNVVERLIEKAKANQRSFEHGNNVEWQRTGKELQAAKAEAEAVFQSLYDRIDVQREALVKCRAQFLEYERHHRDEAERLMLERDTSKVAVARLAKAARNREMADMIDASLTQGGKTNG